MEVKDKILACLNILKRLPPTQIQKNADALAALIPDNAEELYQRIDKPLELAIDEKSGNKFICSEFNRDGDSFRSPISNTYHPEIEDAIYPSDYLRGYEEKANILFEEYKKLYYEGGVSSCYFWDKDDGGFATAWLVRKNVEKTKGVDQGSWSSINVIDVKSDASGKKWTYKITSSVVLEMNIVQPDTGNFNVTGSLTKQKEEQYQLDNSSSIDIFHLERIGCLVEEAEGYLRGYLDSTYVAKTKDIIFQTRFQEGEKAFLGEKMKLAEEIKQMNVK